MRGKERVACLSAHKDGITPAYAGKRGVSKIFACPHRDHPRVCGEKPHLLGQFGRVVGSPPRMRGKERILQARATKTRITPAYAGKSDLALSMSAVQMDHPRVCGEKSFSTALSVRISGSPPRMRGKVDVLDIGLDGGRITPAYAGKRLKRSRSTVPPVAIVPLFPSVCNKPVVSDGSPAGRDAPLFLPAENAVPASPAYNLRSL